MEVRSKGKEGIEGKCFIQFSKQHVQLRSFEVFDFKLLNTSWATQLCLGFLLSALSLCSSVSMSLPSVFLFLPSISISLTSVFLFLPSISLSLPSFSVSLSPSFFPDKKFPVQVRFPALDPSLATTHLYSRLSQLF